MFDCTNLENPHDKFRKSRVVLKTTLKFSTCSSLLVVGRLHRGHPALFRGGHGDQGGVGWERGGGRVKKLFFYKTIIFLSSRGKCGVFEITAKFLVWCCLLQPAFFSASRVRSVVWRLRGFVCAR